MNKFDSHIFSESLLLKALQEKSMQKSAHNDYLDIFLTFKKQVSLEVDFIVQNFPEYTPHNEEYHLRRLLVLADEILGSELISRLNATELLVLCLSIFGHDWGMAVSAAEKKQISSLFQNKDENFGLLRNERRCFSEHLEKFNEKHDNVTEFVWQEYIRLTHAERSAERVRKYFWNIDSGIGEAAARVCVGHWLDFKDVKNSSIYPVSYMVRGESINLRAITLYLRLIDLFDISNERTPYTIYKHVAPQSMRSKMEWAKHEAINSLATKHFQNGREIQVDGQTDDYEVFAALEDLKSFCEDQLFGCNDLLQELNDSRYNLNIFDLKWNILPIDFDPISIKFQFERNRMFEVLSDEIYKGDKYVFIRELLQNSIDAIKLRKEWIEKKTQLTLNSFGEITIDVRDTHNNNIEITFTDDGIGMDRYIVENYLSVAGRSYYSSEEFKELGLEMDPISKFGVGILSCFMVADKIHITTYRDLVIKPDAKVLHIDIPYIDQQFRISANDPDKDKDKIGTKIVISLSKDKVKSKLDDNPDIDITGYLKKLVGFVEFPIVITENDNKTVIINPFEDAVFYGKKYQGYEIYKLDTSLDFNNVFLPQSLKLAKDTFTTKQFTIESDLGMEGIVGSVTFVVPKDPFLKIREAAGGSWPTTDFSLISPGKRTQDRKIKISREWANFTHANMPNTYKYGASSFSKDAYKIYLDGIIIPKANPPYAIEGPTEGRESMYFDSYFVNERFMVPFVVAKYTKRHFSSIDLSRTEVREKDFSWDQSISVHLFAHIVKIHREFLLDEDIKIRIKYFTYLMFFYRVPVSVIVAEIGLDNCPILTIDYGGDLKFETWGNFRDKEIYIQPEYTYWFKQILLKGFDESYKEKHFLSDWKSDKFLINDIIYPELYNEYNSSSQAILASQLVKSYIDDTHDFHSYRFLSSPWEDGPALIQPVWVPKSHVRSLVDYELVKTAAKDMNLINPEEADILVYSLFDALSENNFDVFPDIGVFQKPYDSNFAYGVSILNFNHPFTRGLLRILACIQVYEETKKEVSVPWAKLIDKCIELPFFDPNTYFDNGFSLNEVNLIIDEMNEMIISANLIMNYKTLNHIDFDSFVENTVMYYGDDIYYQFFNNIENEELDLNENYGKKI
ncbi:ATP-binding protein [Chryseobacterium fluminis]|uniref:HD domain-containing protein n=1 Tax=Chryseobacterium fluminis TaxID=2983606 RepID=UPI00224C85F4|nr:ATP-binding protein [Chryseobacterium sp. MMS21-Ot14]UZT99612.1 ATP-binding protein [Chryseobacterium sp. MMS21-Ot14]